MQSRGPPAELEVLRDGTRRLEAADIAYMLTGSFAPDYYVSEDAVRAAAFTQSSFNLIHLAEVVKVDCIPRRPGPYHQAEFARRRRVTLGDFDAWVVSAEDLVPAKLLWARGSRSETQLRDVRTLLDSGVDRACVERWVTRLATERLAMGARMFDVARTLVLASLPPGLPPDEIRRRPVARLYPELTGEQLPPAWRRG